MSKSLKKIFVFFICCVPALHCSKLKSENDPSISVAEEESVPNTKGSPFDMYYELLKAGYYSNIGNSPKALKVFNNVFSMEPPVYVYEQYVRLLFDIGNVKKILNLYLAKMSDFDSKFKKNLDFWLVVAQSFLITNQDKQAEKIFSKLIKDYPDNEQVAYYYTMSMIKNNMINDALAYLNECLNKASFKSKYFLFYFLRSNIHIHQNNLELALKDIDTGLEQQPNSDIGLRIKAKIFECQGKINQAISVYMQLLSVVGRHGAIEQHIIQLLCRQKRYDDVAKYLKKFNGDTAEYYFNLSLVEFNSCRYKHALKCINICIKRAPTLVPARLLKVDILLSLHELKLAVQFLEDWLNEKSLNHTATRALLLLSKTQIQPKDILKILERATLKHKDDIGLLSALSDLYAEQKMFDKALGIYKKIHDTTTNEGLKSKVLFHMAFIHFINSQSDKAENILTKATKIQPIYPQSLNLLAYIYASKDKNLATAMELVNKALEFDRYSPFYLDTKGVILLKTGKHTQALELFEKASTISPGDKDITDHITQAKSLIDLQKNLAKNNEK